MFSRRRFLEASLFAGASSVMAARLALANAPTDSRFVFVLLRGALDGLSAVPAVGDPDYAAPWTDCAPKSGTMPRCRSMRFRAASALKFLH